MADRIELRNVFFPYETNEREVLAVKDASLHGRSGSVRLPGRPQRLRQGEDQEHARRLHNPSVLLMDEPFDEFEAMTRDEVQQMQVRIDDLMAAAGDGLETTRTTR